jgi:nucleoside-diphosphate kinase
VATERTLILFKPDALQRRLIGRLVSRFEDKGLKIVGLKMLKVTPELARQHYAEHVHKSFYAPLEQFITSAPVIAMVLQGPEAIRVVRDMLGPTNGRNAAPGTIRGDFGLSRQMNLIHGSDGPDAAQREIDIYFAPDELFDYDTTLGCWVGAPDEL